LFAGAYVLPVLRDLCGGSEQRELYQLLTCDCIHSHGTCRYLRVGSAKALHRTELVQREPAGPIHAPPPARTGGAVDHTYQITDVRVLRNLGSRRERVVRVYYRFFYKYSEYITLFCDPYWDYVYQAHNYEINIMYIYSKVLTDLGFYLRITKLALNNMKTMIDIYKDDSKILEFYLLIDDIQEIQKSFLYAVIAAQIR
jgi:hypothetical protein